MCKKLLTNKRFLTGLCILILLVVSSYILESYFKTHKINPIRTAPAPPSLSHPLGVNARGYDVLRMVLTYAKAPIISAFFISFMRITLSLIFAFFYAYFYRGARWFNWLFESFQYVPPTLLGILLLSPVQYLLINQRSQWFIYIIAVLILIGIPNLTQLIGNEIRLLLHNEFVTSSKILGGGIFHIFKTHIQPYLLPKMFLWLNQQLLQVLVLIMHLSLFHVILSEIGGSIFMISSNFQLLMLTPWVAYGPVLFFTLLILVAYMMSSDVQSVLQTESKFAEHSLLLSMIRKEQEEGRTKRKTLLKRKQVHIGK
ncbi:peptide ABC transporter permease [Bacillus cereus group sp. BfR-BA-01380]|uniref:peptide ABC transporter permease n=1 Tax=Bacillus cereus group sp. BfR-BA-01380 TaxID=2920324 RepID=UPI001F5A3673|nr:peptide ABC transporter permease [Bacillus cereus group sp. BfR-BA-01380]